jgi:hypothetical protein
MVVDETSCVFSLFFGFSSVRNSPNSHAVLKTDNVNVEMLNNLI